MLNTGDRPIQVGSHFHFADVNDALRSTARPRPGFRLDIPAGTSVRFEPGAERDGRRWSRSAARGASPDCQVAAMTDRPRARYADAATARPSATACGWPTPTSGSRSRRTAASAATRPSSAAARRSASRCCRARHPRRGRARPRDHQRRRARPLGRRQGRRRHPGRPDRRAGQGRQPGRRWTASHPELEIGPSTEVIAGEGRILTAGGDRLPRALHLPADRRRGARHRA